MLAVVGGLNHFAVRRLQQTWGRVQAKKREVCAYVCVYMCVCMCVCYVCVCACVSVLLTMDVMFACTGIGEIY